MTLPFPPPSGYKFLENTHKSYRTNTRAFLVNYTPSSKLNCTLGYFLEKLHFSATSSLCQLQEKVGCAHQKSSPHTHTFPPPPRRIYQRCKRRRYAPAASRRHFPRNASTPGARGPCRPACDPPVPTQDQGDCRARWGRPASPVRAAQR